MRQAGYWLIFGSTVKPLLLPGVEKVGLGIAILPPRPIGPLDMQNLDSQAKHAPSG
jgi:hypothetical protein